MDDKFPLWQHKRRDKKTGNVILGPWCKKIDGTVYYFGKDKTEALAKYLALLDEKKSGLRQEPTTLADSVNGWLEAKDADRKSGEISDKTFGDYWAMGRRLVAHFGRERILATIRPHELVEFRNALARQYKPATLNRMITVAKMPFAFAFQTEMITTAVKVEVMKPAKRAAVKRTRSPRWRVLTAAECQYLLANADPVVKAMVLVGLNAGYGRADIHAMQPEFVRGEWLESVRVKTQIARKCWLWPETRSALDGMVPFEGSVHQIGRGLARLFDDCQIDAVPYSLRHTCIDLMSQTGDMLAVQVVAGHAGTTMTERYIHSVDENRIMHVCQTVWSRLFGEQEGRMGVVG